MKTDQLTRKIDDLATQIQPVEVVKQIIPFDFSLFTPKEPNTIGPKKANMQEP